MKLRKLIDKKFYTLFFITMILFVLSLVSMSLGYYRATVAGNTTSQTGTAGVLKINYAGLNELNISNAAPIYADGYKDNANHIDFTINGIDNTLNGCYNLELYVETLTDNLKDETFRWILYDNTNDIPVASGDFFNASQGDAILLLDEQDLIKDVTNINYSLYVFLENSEEKNQISMMGGSFRGKIRGIVNYKECVESTKEITFTTTPFNTVMYANGNSLEVQIVGNNIGRIICTSSNSSVATCGINQRTLTITPESVGTTVIVVRDMRTGRSLRYNITVLSTSVEVNPDSGTVYIGGTNTATATITGENLGRLSCFSANSAIASCSITVDNQLQITAGTTTGPVEITVTEANGNQTDIYTATTARATYTVTLDNQLATTAGTTSVTATYGLSMPAITIPTKTGYTFGGYYTGTGGTGTQYYNSAGASTNNWNNTAGATLYAKWTIKTYAVTITSGAGGSIYVYNNATSALLGSVGSGGTGTINVTHGTTIRMTYTPSTGYEVNTSSGASTQITGATTISATWRLKTYAVTITSGAGGSIYVYNNATSALLGSVGSGGTGSINVTHGTVVRVTYSPNSNYVVNTSSGSPLTITAATTISATWRLNAYTLTYHANGGSNAPTAVQFTPGSQVTITSSKPTKPGNGYEFLGWNSSPSGNGTYYTPGVRYSFGSSVTLYAIWEEWVWFCYFEYINQNEALRFDVGEVTNSSNACQDSCSALGLYYYSSGNTRAFTFKGTYFKTGVSCTCIDGNYSYYEYGSCDYTRRNYFE